jgi:dipeptidase
MCDTMVALGDQTADGAVLFGKNSDRERNEAQYLEALPRRRHAKGARVKLTHVEIEEARETNAVLLSKPYWIWGAEIGANEHGVVIGNEAVFAKRLPSQRPGIIGMDYLRLGLERAASAAEALEVMTRLLEQHGQDGNCGHLTKRTYHNSYLIADPTGAWVLETVGRDWVAERVSGVRSISNALSINSAYDRISANLKTLVGDRPVAATMTNPKRDARSQGHQRCARSASLLGNRRGRLELKDILAALRDHGPAEARWHPDQVQTKAICMHAAWGTSGGQTTGAMASWLKPARRAVHWVTGSAAPCLSVFKPVFVDLGLPLPERKPTGRFDGKTRWWRHELLHRAVLEDFNARAASFAAERDALETNFMRRIAKVADADAATRRKAVAACWHEADEAEERWHAAVDAMPCDSRPAAAYRRAWAKFNRLAGIAPA